jgi:pyridoxine 5-phosphate synthase
MKFGVNIDHIATLRNARGGDEPDLLTGMREAIRAGCDSIVCHLRMDRRHIRDNDIYSVKKECGLPLNFEASLEPEIVDIILDIKPEITTLVPEKREEVTTEGGLDVVKNMDRLKKNIPYLKAKGITVSLFVDPELDIIDAVKESGAESIELHTGKYSNLSGKAQEEEFKKLVAAADYAKKIGLFVAAGHGLNYKNTAPIAGIKSIEELNIGHSIISRSIFIGLYNAVKEMQSIIKNN